MPIYEYKCNSCHQSFDKLVRKSADIDQIFCPTCGGGDIKKKLSLFSSQGISSPISSSSSYCSPGGT